MHVTVQRTIPKPASEVFEFFSDASNNPQWQKGMVSCTWASDDPIAVGSTYEQVATFMGKEIRSTFSVTEYEPGRRIVIDTIESTFPIHVERKVEPINNVSCRVSAVISGGPGGVMKLLARLTDKMAQRSIEADYDRLVEVFT